MARSKGKIMQRIWSQSAGLLALLFTAQICTAETQESPKFYKLEFVVKEVEGTKVLNARAYSATVATGNLGNCSIRAGSKVPIPAAGAQFTFENVGVNIDFRSVQEVGGDLSMNLSADVTTALQESTNLPPIIRQNRWSSTVIVPLKKSTVVFSSDDATSKRQMQLELTATPIK
jgi:hypothetical protein